MERAISRYQITLRHGLVAVYFVAVSLGMFRAVHHFSETRSLGLASTLGILLVLLPPIYALMVASICKPGPWKTWWILVLGGLPVAIGLLFVLGLTLYITASVELHNAPHASINLMGALAAGYFLLRMVRWIVPKRCPACGRISSIRDRSHGTGTPEAIVHRFWCAACGARS
jgi:hypothetical protein